MELFLCLVLFTVGMYALLTKRSTLKIIIGIGIMGYAINVMLLVIGYSGTGTMPILFHGTRQDTFADPLAQSMVLVTVVTGLAATILLTVIGIRLYQKYKTLNIDEIRKLKG